MTREEFVAGYAKRSGLTVEDVLKFNVPAPCNCGEAGCQGWAMLSPQEAALTAPTESPH